MVKKKVSLGSSPDLESDGRGAAGEAVLPAHRAAAIDVLELFFNTGIIFHDVAMPRGLPDTVSSFIVMQGGGAAAGDHRLTADPVAQSGSAASASAASATFQAHQIRGSCNGSRIHAAAAESNGGSIPFMPP